MASKKVRAISNGVCLQSYFYEARKVLDSQLQVLLPVVSKLRLHEQIEYALKTEGKRLRSSLVFLSGESVGAEKHVLGKLALGIELLHLATLVHDDILDQDVFRRKSLSVQAKWSVKEAILVGDAIASLGLSLGKEYSKEIIDIMASTCLQLSDGEYLDVEASKVGLTEEYYFEKIKKKTASLFRAAAECGAIAGEGTSDEIRSLASFGENYGLAFQIRDDLQDVLSNENMSLSGLSELKATLPIICLNQKSRKEAQILINKLGSSKKRNGEESQALLKELEILLNKSGSIDYCRQRIDDFIDKAVSSINLLDENKFLNYLREMTEALRLKQFSP